MESINKDKETILREILTNVMVLTRLYSVQDTEFRTEYVMTGDNPRNRIITPMINYNYVTIRRKNAGQVYDSIKQSSVSKGLTDEYLSDIFEELRMAKTAETTSSYQIQGDRLVSVEEHHKAERHPLLIIDHCHASNKARFSFHVSLLKDKIPSKLDNVDYLIKSSAIKKGKPEKNEGNFAPYGYSMGCIICMDRTRDILIKPCNHMIMCLLCTHTLKDYKCPVCKANISSLERVYLS